MDVILGKHLSMDLISFPSQITTHSHDFGRLESNFLMGEVFIHAIALFIYLIHTIIGAVS